MLKLRNVNFTSQVPPSLPTGSVLKEWRWTLEKSMHGPTTVKELQRFLGFAHFYRRFIRNYSSIAAPLTSLLKGKPKKLSWTAQVAFETLKTSFTTAPILKHLDPDSTFIVEVDASDLGIGAVLSQRHGNPGKIFPSAFFPES